MDALTTARRVLRWASDPVGAPPSGPLRRLATLGAPDEPCLAAVRHLVRTAGALLGAGDPPWGDRTPVGPGVLLLAAAAGGRADPGSTDLARLAPESGLPGSDRWADGLARHALVCAVITAPGAGVSAPLADALRAASPVTTALFGPVGSAYGPASDLALRLLEQPGGTQTLTAVLARPSTDPAVLGWRARLLELLRQHRLEVMLDVYLAARLWHGAAWDRQIRSAHDNLTGTGLPDPAAVATVRFWGPLAVTDRNEMATTGLAGRIAGAAVVDRRRSIRDRIFLRQEQYEPVVELFMRYSKVLTTEEG